MIRCLFIGFLLTLGISSKAQLFDQEWVKHAGGNNGYLVPWYTTTDDASNIYVIGRFSDTTDFSTDTTSFVLSTPGMSTSHVFTAKYDSEGNLIWVNSLIVGNGAYPRGIAVDAYGSVVIIGAGHDSIDIEPGINEEWIFGHGGADYYVIKYDSNGSLDWGEMFGGEWNDIAFGLTIDKDRNIYVGGRFTDSIDLDPDTSSHILTNDSGEAFIQVLDEDGHFISAINFGNSAIYVNKLVIDDSNHLYAAGRYSSSGLFFLNGAPVSIGGGSNDIFLIQFDFNLLANWHVGYGNSVGIDWLSDIAFDDSLNVYSVGFVRGPVDFDPGPTSYIPPFYGNRDIYIQKLSKAGDFIWANQYGAGNDDEGSSIALDDDGYIYVSGNFEDSLRLDTVQPWLNLYSNGGIDVCLFKCLPSGKPIWSKSFGTTSTEGSHGIRLDESGSITVTGRFVDEVDFSLNNDTLLRDAEGSIDLFMMRFSECYSTGSLVQTVCDSTLSPSSFHTYTSTGSYIDTVVNSQGCDSLIYIDLTVFESNSIWDTAEACYTYTWSMNNVTYDSSATPSVIYTNAFGCDSIRNLALTVLNSTFSNTSVSACDSFQWTSNDSVYSSSGIYFDTLINSVGCDSFLILNLSIISHTYSTKDTTHCDSFLLPSGNKTIYNDTTLTDTITNSAGCDSLITFNITILNATTANYTMTTCTSLFWIDETYTQSGLYYDTLSNQFGCDSLISLSLEILTPSFDSISITACDSFVSPSGSFTWYQSGTYLDTLINSQGCDSILTILLSILHPSEATVSLTACENYTWPLNGITYYTSGTYQVVITNAAGCDSNVHLQLLVLPAAYNLEQASACDSFFWPVSGEIYHMSGTYEDTSSNSSGCNVYTTLQLKVTSIDTTVSQSLDTLIANQASAKYQWLTCDSSFQALVGDTFQSLIAIAGGVFAAEIKLQGCIDTTNCHQVAALGAMLRSVNSTFLVYPNPVQSKLYVVPAITGIYHCKLLSLDGRLIANWPSLRGPQQIDLGQFSSGVFLLQLGSRQQFESIRIVHQ
ncbi:MAG: SBBP repeat-containing protein [Cryomorphaceae bacterium]